MCVLRYPPGASTVSPESGDDAGDPGAVGEVSSAGEYNWGGAAGTRFWIDPQENMIGLFMVQSIPHRTRLAGDFKVLAYQAMTESYAD